MANSKDIDVAVDQYTEWLHGMINGPEYLECDQCERLIDEDSPTAIDFGGGFFCCDVCLEQALNSNDLLKEEWTQRELSEDGFLPV